MRRISVWAGMLTLSLMTVVGAVRAEAPASAKPDYAQERAERAKVLTQPYGWFSLVALQAVKPGGLTSVGSAKDNTVVLQDAPAHLLALQETNGTVTLIAADASLTVQGHAVPGGAHPVIGKDEDDAAALASGSLRMWVIDRGGKRYLRVKDSEAPALKHFHGLSFYAPDERYRVVARWVPYTTPHTMQVLNKLGQITPTPVPGYVEFEMGGKKQMLTPLEASNDSLWFVFRDETYKQTTDGGGRFLYTAKGPSNGLNKTGTVVLDFNEAENPPCAYSPYATCPLASPENRLPIAVPAGEKRYE